MSYLRLFLKFMIKMSSWSSGFVLKSLKGGIISEVVRGGQIFYLSTKLVIVKLPVLGFALSYWRISLLLVTLFKFSFPRFEDSLIMLALELVAAIE